MELLLINQELSESRMFRTTSSMRTLNGRDVADLAYLNTLVVYLMLQDDVQHDFAKDYATRTAQHGAYRIYKTHATDLYMLCYVLSNPDNSHVRLRDHSESANFLNRLKFDSYRHYLFMRTLSNSADKTNEAVSYFFRLESQLNISNSAYKQYRRLVTDWGNLKYSAKQLAVVKITQEIRKIARGSEVIAPLSTMLKYKNYMVEPEYQAPRTSFTKKVAGAVVGAAAGRYVAGKLATTNVDRAKTVGTGLGAIAGYWAAGRSKR
jgi:hypothetical protein